MMNHHPLMLKRFDSSHEALGAVRDFLEQEVAGSTRSCTMKGTKYEDILYAQGRLELARKVLDFITVAPDE